ncbi:hypothetical protein [Treponema sp.]|uniref:hypothetical protein n=1 Tax=Treponema sp. TaxID=166 RepID=UPI0025F2AC68|nr:hypothetical protein [Treponema sp.]MCR5219206.1 hypothetical protein [Treponema sp.]
MSENKKKTEKPENLDSFTELEGQRPKSDTTKTAEEKKEALVKIRALKTIRGVYGAFDSGNEYEVPESTADILCKDERAKKC